MLADDTENEAFATQLRAFGSWTQLPRRAADDLFADPRRITDLLTRSDWQEVQVTPVTQRRGSDPTSTT